MLSRNLAFIGLNDVLLFQDIALMDEQEREGFIKKIGISADDSDETDEDEDEDDPEHHKYNCKKCQVSLLLTVTEKLGSHMEHHVSQCPTQIPHVLLLVSSCHLQKEKST